MAVTDGLTVEIYPLDGPDAFTASRSTYQGQVAVPRKGDLVDLRFQAYRVVAVSWVYTDEWPTRVVVKVRLAFPEKRKWIKRRKGRSVDG